MNYKNWRVWIKVGGMKRNMLRNQATYTRVKLVSSFASRSACQLHKLPKFDPMEVVSSDMINSLLQHVWISTPTSWLLGTDNTDDFAPLRQLTIALTNKSPSISMELLSQATTTLASGSTSKDITIATMFSAVTAGIIGHGKLSIFIPSGITSNASDHPIRESTSICPWSPPSRWSPLPISPRKRCIPQTVSLLSECGRDPFSLHSVQIQSVFPIQSRHASVGYPQQRHPSSAVFASWRFLPHPPIWHPVHSADQSIPTSLSRYDYCCVGIPKYYRVEQFDQRLPRQTMEYNRAIRHASQFPRSTQGRDTHEADH